MNEEPLSIGAVSERSGVASSALRFYEAEGLITSDRTGGGQRRFARGVLRRVAFIGAAQAVGLDLKQIHAALLTLPEARTPTRADWQRLSRTWRPLLDARIDALTRLRDQLASCIGCGCLSLTRCRLYNAGDAASRLGPGPRYLMGDRPPAVVAPPAGRGPAPKRRSR
jgi:MerR family transcriptional regulator, redox-sensitive transcriptional activator SoxR